MENALTFCLGPDMNQNGEDLDEIGMSNLYSHPTSEDLQYMELQDRGMTDLNNNLSEPEFDGFSESLSI